LNRSELIKILAKKANIKEKSAEKLIISFGDVISEALKKGEKVVYSNFGTFYTVHYPSKVIYHPILGSKKKMVMLPTDAIKWMPSGNIKDMVDRGTEREEITKFGSTKKLKEEKKKAGIIDRKAIEIPDHQKLMVDDEEIEIPIKINKKNELKAVYQDEETKEKDLIPFEKPGAQISFVDLKDTTIPHEVLCLVPLEMAQKTKVVPIDLKDEMLILGMTDPKDLDAIELIKKTVRKKVSPRLISESDLDKIFAQYEGEALLNHKEDIGKVVTDKEENEQIEISKSAPAKRILALILKRSLREKAKSVHFDFFEDALVVSFRVNNKSIEKTTLPKSIGKALISYLKTLADYQEQEPTAESVIKEKIDETQEEFDLLIVATAGGEKVVITPKERIRFVKKIADLDLRENDLNRLRDNLANPGLTLVNSSSNYAGQSVFYAVADFLKEKGLNVITIESNIEFVLKGITQIKLNGINANQALDLAAKLDPDAILVNQTISREILEKAFVLFPNKTIIAKTMAEDSISAYQEVFSLGIDKKTLVQKINLSIGTKELNRICPDCRELSKPDNASIRKIRDELSSIPGEERAKLRKLGTHFYAGKGCRNCNNQGVINKVSLFEIFLPTERIRDRLSEENINWPEVKKEAVRAGMTTIAQDGIIKSLVGLVSVEEVLD